MVHSTDLHVNSHCSHLSQRSLCGLLEQGPVLVVGAFSHREGSTRGEERDISLVGARQRGVYYAPRSRFWLARATHLLTRGNKLYIESDVSYYTVSYANEVNLLIQTAMTAFSDVV